MTRELLNLFVIRAVKNLQLCSCSS